ncbi:MAG: gliding motility protein GldM [Prevotellaceae bacterium]|jgi:gliding motility-associated protein GldM|nr:gliding motility protein GldM [Prevotellaceae bacterium]
MAQGNLSPRQRMINMMYLVLTAMLALNVSNEVLDAFETIENRFGQSIDIVKQNNESRFSNFDIAAENSSVEKVKPWKDKAQQVKDKTHELTSYIDSLKKELIFRADGQKARLYTGDFSKYKLENREDTDVGTQLLYGNEESKGVGYDLRDKIEKYKNHLIAILSESAHGEQLVSTIKGMLRTDDVSEGIDGTKDWVYATFYNAPAISDLAILSSISLDVRNCEAQMTNYLLEQIDASSFKFSNIQVAVIPNSSYIIKGTPLEASIFLAAYDPSVRPTAKIGSSVFNSNEEGKILYKSVQNSVGMHRLTGVVEYPGPDGLEQVKFDFPYQVGEAAAVISPTKMNVFYLGVDNPVEISVSGVPQEKISASCNGGQLRREGAGYVVNPNAGSKTCEISVSAEINGVHQPMKAQMFRVKKLPTPNAVVSGITGKTATKGELAASQGLKASMPDDFEFDLKYTVTSFRVSITGSGGYEKEEASNGAYFSQAQRNLFNNLRPGQRVFISDIKATGPGGAFDLATLDIRIK